VVVSPPARVLVAGSRGFIGRAVSRHLGALGVGVIDAGRHTGVDFANARAVSTLPPCDAVVHLAGRTDVADAHGGPLPFFQDNVVSTLHLLEHARRHGSAFVLASSYVYGQPRYLPVDETHPVAAIGPYATSKVMAEDLARAYHRDAGVPVVILRLFNVYGSGQRDRFLVPAIVNGLRAGALRLGRATPRRDFVHVEDVAEAFAAALTCRSTEAEVFNIGSGRSISVRDLVETMTTLSRRQVPVEYDTHARAGDLDDVVADVRKAARVLGWRPRVALEAGLSRLLDEALAGAPARSS
jgi:UDP-glucose 4-epimerase